MTISELITKLQKIQKEHGDLTVVEYGDEFGKCYDPDEDRYFLKVVKAELQPDHNDPDWRYVEFPLCSEELLKKCTKEVLVL